MLSQLSEIQTQIKDYNITVGQLTTKINELTLKVDEMTGDIVSEGVTGIGERLFQYCDNLKTVSLPTTLTAIKKAAFLPHIDD